MSDQVKLALISIAGLVISNGAAIILTWLNIRNKVNGHLDRLQTNVERQNTIIAQHLSEETKRNG
jgi:hypothetical protein